MGVAVVLAITGNDEGPADGSAAAAPCAGRDVSTLRPGGGAAGAIGQESDAAQREKYLKTAWGKRYIKGRIRRYLTG